MLDAPHAPYSGLNSHPSSVHLTAELAKCGVGGGEGGGEGGGDGGGDGGGGDGGGEGDGGIGGGEGGSPAISSAQQRTYAVLFPRVQK